MTTFLYYSSNPYEDISTTFVLLKTSVLLIIIQLYYVIQLLQRYSPVNSTGNKEVVIQSCIKFNTALQGCSNLLFCLYGGVCYAV